MAKRDYYETLGSPGADRRGAESGFPQGGDAMPSRPQSRRPRRPSKFKELNEAYQHPVRRRRNARPTTATAMRPSSRAGQRHGRRLRRLDVGYLRRSVRRHHGPPRRRSGPGSERGADLRYNLEITLEEAFAARPRRFKLPTSVDLRSLRRHGRQGRHQADDLPDLRRPRPRARPAGIFHDRADLPALPRPRPDRSTTPATCCARLRPRDARTHALRQYSARASRTAPASALPAKAKPACAAARRAISTFSSRSSRIRSSSATAPISIAACRFRWCRRRWAANSRCPRSTAAKPR